MGQPERDIERAELPNGLVVVTEKMPHVRSVSVGIWIGTGSRGESPERNGIAHFIEHMVFKGTARRTAEEIAQAMDSVGGMLDAFTAKELTCFNAKVLDEHLPIAFDVLSDLVLRPKFEDDDIAKEKQVVLEEIKMDEGQSRVSDSRDVHAKFLARAPAGPADSGHSGNRAANFARRATGLLPLVVRAEQYGDHRGGKPGARAIGGPGFARIRRSGTRRSFRAANGTANECRRRAAAQERTRTSSYRAGRSVVSSGA